MKTINRLHLSLIFILTTFHFTKAQEFPFSSSKWVIEAEESTIKEYQGKQALYLKNGLAQLKDFEFLNGIIEFDISLPKERGFPGVLFRMQDKENNEEFYVRPHQSGNPDANQYTPVFNRNAAWQLYHGEGFNKAYTYPVDTWMHIKLLIKDSQAEVYFDEELILQIKELKMGIKAGSVGLRSSLCPVYFANLKVTKTDAIILRAIPAKEQKTDETIITQWLVSPSFSREALAGKTSLLPVFGHYRLL